MDSTVLTSLAPEESDALQSHEETIERGLATFVDVGNALAAIRDGRLYRAQYSNFESYCRERWKFSRSRAHRLIDAAEVAEMLPMGNTPASERQARELAPLRDNPAQVQEAWQEVRDLHGEDITAAKVKEVVRTKMDVHYSSATDEWATPQDLFDVVNAEFGFTLDVCALDSSAKCSDYFTPQDNGLAQQWAGVCWMNPPYGNEIGKWIEKAWKSAQAGATVVCLVPARVDTAWWWDYCRYGQIRFIRGRLKFGNAETSAPFPSAVVIFDGSSVGVEWWDWRGQR